MKTCGSTLSNACSRSFIAYLAKSAAVAYGEVDCSSPKTFGAPATKRLKQTARSPFMQTALSLSDSTPLGKLKICQTALVETVLQVRISGQEPSIYRSLTSISVSESDPNCRNDVADLSRPKLATGEL